VIFLIVEYQLLRKNSSKELVSESELSIWFLWSLKKTGFNYTHKQIAWIPNQYHGHKFI
jgi:hypothetical protein